MGNLMRLKYLCSSFSTPLKQEDASDKGEYKVYGASGFVGYSNSYGNESNYLGIVFLEQIWYHGL